MVRKLQEAVSVASGGDVQVRDESMQGDMLYRLDGLIQARRTGEVDYQHLGGVVTFRPSEGETAVLAIVNPSHIASERALRRTISTSHGILKMPVEIAALAAVSLSAEVSRNPAFREVQLAQDIYRQDAAIIAGAILPGLDRPGYDGVRLHLQALLNPVLNRLR